jgi:tRNA threonylcarbamoyladenosine modification (KEOPS) complex  Pcc1 subunit
MTIRSTFKIDFQNPGLAEKFYCSLLPEARTTKSKTAKVSIARHGSVLAIDIESSTIASSRALLNSYIRWISTSLEIVNLKGD